MPSDITSETPTEFKDRLVRYWWLIAVQAVAAIAFGVLALIWPGPALNALILLFGAFAMACGVIAVIEFVTRAFRHKFDWVLLVPGLAGLGAGIVVITWPALTALTLLYVIAIWAIVSGVFEFAEMFRKRSSLEVRAAFGLAGVVSVALGILLIALRPEAGILALIWLVGAYAIMNGVLWGFGTYRLRQADKGDPEVHL